jgi:ABC-type branched-subunit amino acid transport system permease subunit
VRLSKLGIGLFAIHDDEDVAEVMGVPTFRYKLLAFACRARWPAWRAASTRCSCRT